MAARIQPEYVCDHFTEPRDLQKWLNQKNALGYEVLNMSLQQAGQTSDEDYRAAMWVSMRLKKGETDDSNKTL